MNIWLRFNVEYFKAKNKNFLLNPATSKLLLTSFNISLLYHSATPWDLESSVKVYIGIVPKLLRYDRIFLLVYLDPLFI